jgi:hypothetical protein
LEGIPEPMPPEDASLRQRPVKALGSEAENLGGIPWTEEYRVTIETEISNIEALVLLFKVSNCFVPHLSWSRGWSTYKGRRSWLRDRGGQEYGIPNEPQTTTVKAILLQFVKHEQDFSRCFGVDKCPCGATILTISTLEALWDHSLLVEKD